ncbi:MAG: hypothetical protein U1F77_07015 [Kiritimatiellia bacterium]
MSASFLWQDFSFKGVTIDFEKLKPFLTDLLYVRSRFSDTIPECRDTNQAFINDEHVKLYEALAAEISNKMSPTTRMNRKASNRTESGSP